jgi:hypothetical protein
LGSKPSKTSRWPKAPSLRKLGPEQRVNMAIEMSSAMGELVLDSIRDRNPRISERKLLNEARKRIYAGRRVH